MKLPTVNKYDREIYQGILIYAAFVTSIAAGIILLPKIIVAVIFILGLVCGLAYFIFLAFFAKVE